MPRYKKCTVPMCRSTSIIPGKVFITVSKRAWCRKRWFKAASVNYESMKKNQLLYFCEDHFDMEQDVEKSPRTGKLRAKRHVVPHKFECQRNGIQHENVRRSTRLVTTSVEQNSAPETNTRRSERLRGSNNDNYGDAQSSDSEEYQGDEEMNDEFEDSFESDMSDNEGTQMSLQSEECAALGSSSSSAAGDYIIKTEAEEMYVDVDAESVASLEENQLTGDEQDPLMDAEPVKEEADDSWQRSETPPPRQLDSVFSYEEGNSILDADSPDDPWQRSDTPPPRPLDGVFSCEDGNSVLDANSPTEESDNPWRRSKAPSSRPLDGVFSYEEGNSILGDGDSDPDLVVMVNPDEERRGMYVYNPVNTVAETVTPTNSVVYKAHDFVSDSPRSETSALGYAQEYWSDEAAVPVVYSAVVGGNDMTGDSSDRVDPCAYVYETQLHNKAYVRVEPTVGVNETFLLETKDCGNTIVVTNPSIVRPERGGILAVDALHEPAQMLIYNSRENKLSEEAPETLVYHTNGNDNSFLKIDKVHSIEKPFVYSTQPEIFMYETSDRGRDFVADSECEEIFLESADEAGHTFAYDTNAIHGTIRVGHPESAARAFAFHDESAVVAGLAHSGTFDSTEYEEEETYIPETIMHEAGDAVTEDIDLNENGVIPLGMWTYKRSSDPTKRGKYKKDPPLIPKSTPPPSPPPRSTVEELKQELQRVQRDLPPSRRNTATEVKIREREQAWHKIQRELAEVSKKQPTGPATCKVCGRHLRRKQCLHIL